MTKRKWTDGQFLEPGGHRIFREDRGAFAAPETLRWAIADNSGPRPDTTDDGILWLDFGRRLRIDSKTCGIPVRSERDPSCDYLHVPAGVQSAVTLHAKFPNWGMEQSKDVMLLLQLFASPAAAARDEPADSPIPKMMKLYVVSVRGKAAFDTVTNEYVNYDEYEDNARNMLIDVLNDEDDGYSEVSARITPVDVPASVKNIDDWLNDHKSLWAAE